MWPPGCVESYLTLIFISCISYLTQATKEEINNAFRQLSRIYHPDKHGTDDNKKEKAQELFTRIKKAHEGRNLWNI